MAIGQKRRLAGETFKSRADDTGMDLAAHTSRLAPAAGLGYKILHRTCAH